ncbi:hypothetical protein, partial [Halostella sp. PRR32]|uniref:hypothetical protein n=1 Tax=Halostella sp. PRR32 TaxID=3098147 RepID=UPI002B1E5CEA
EVEIRVWDAGGTEYVNRTGDEALGYAGPSEVDATVVDDGTLRFDRSLAGLAVAGALVEADDGSTYAGIDGVVDEDGRLAVDD